MAQRGARVPIKSERAIYDYMASLGYPVNLDKLIQNSDQLPSTLCYITRGEHVLLLRRRKEPFKDHWTAPGGKIEDGETPAQAIIREVWEETGQHITSPVLKAVCSEVGEANYNWLLFLFQVQVDEVAFEESDEGELRWIPLANIGEYTLPSIDREIIPYVLPVDHQVTGATAPKPSVDLEDGEIPYIDVVYAPDHSVQSFKVKSLAELV